jgi:hypothetical protein
MLKRLSAVLWIMIGACGGEMLNDGSSTAESELGAGVVCNKVRISTPTTRADGSIYSLVNMECTFTGEGTHVLEICMQRRDPALDSWESGSWFGDTGTCSSNTYVIQGTGSVTVGFVRGAEGGDCAEGQIYRTRLSFKSKDGSRTRAEYFSGESGASCSG